MILDTCALLWLVEGKGKLSRDALLQIEEAPLVYISTISAFEISLKYNKGKLDLPLEPKDWFKIALINHNILLIPLDIDICIKSTNLPDHHKDPCDRFIIATAQIYNFPVVTTDKVFKDYCIEVIN